jgi:hypothetical protein
VQDAVQRDAGAGGGLLGRSEQANSRIRWDGGVSSFISRIRKSSVRGIFLQNLNKGKTSG